MFRIPIFGTCFRGIRFSDYVSLAWLGMSLAGGAHAQIFVVNQGNGTIGKYATSGAVINASFISGLNSPTGIAASGDFLYVAQENGTVRKYATSGSLVNAALITGLYLP